MQRPYVWSAAALLNARVRNSAGENLGKIEDIVIDPAAGGVRYAILSFGGLFGLGDKLFPIPWTSLRMSSARDDVLLDIDRERLERAPAFNRDAWPVEDSAWQRGVDDYYRVERPVVVERDYVDRRPIARSGVSIAGAILLVCLLLALGWVTYLVSTRGWDQAREDVRNSLSGAVYAAKETTQDAALTTKVKTALSLSRRIPADKIDVDSQGDVVTLRGEVPNQELREAAEAIARDVRGVSDVQNHLFVTN